MPRGTRNANEFKRYRQILAALYIGIVATAFVLLAVSVVDELYIRGRSHHPDARRAGNPSHSDLVRCLGDITGLYSELGHRTAELLALPGKDRSAEILPRWKDFSETWLKRWDEVEVSCRFESPLDTARGEAYHSMARVHGELPAMRLEYQSLLIRYDKELAADLARLARELDRSRQLLLRSGQTPDAGEEAR